ncbi:MAG: hypothetical protein ACKPGN_01375 [Dolichospermum sp.]
MSKERLEELLELLKKLEEAKITNYAKITSFRMRLAYICHAPQEFELDQEIQLAEKEIQKIDINIESLRKEIGDMEERSKFTQIKPNPIPISFDISNNPNKKP